MSLLQIFLEYRVEIIINLVDGFSNDGGHFIVHDKTGTGSVKY